MYFLCEKTDNTWFRIIKKYFASMFRKFHYWQESFDGDSFVSQSRFDAYAEITGGVDEML